MATTSALSSSASSHKRSSESTGYEPEVAGSHKRARLNEAGASFQVANAEGNAISNTTSVGTTLSAGNASQPAQPLSMRTVSPMAGLSPLPGGKGLSDPGPETAPIHPDKFRFNTMQTQTVASPVLFSGLSSPVAYPFFLGQYTLMQPPYGSLVNGAQGLPLPPLKLPQPPQSSTNMGVSHSSSNSAQKKLQAQEFERRGMECMLTKNYDAAVQSFEQCLQAGPDEPAKVLNLLGLCVLKDLGVAIGSVDRYEFSDFCRQKPQVDFAKAIGALQKALAVENIQPSLGNRIGFSLAITYLCSGEPQYVGFALELLQAIEKQSNPPATSLEERYFLAKVCYQCAGLLAKLGKIEDANRSYQRVCRLHFEEAVSGNPKTYLLPNDPYQRNLFAQNSLELGILWCRWNQKEAQACFFKILELEKAKGVPNKVIVARTLLEMGMIAQSKEESLKLFNQALGLNFNDSELKDFLLIEIAEIYRNRGNDLELTLLQRAQAQFDYAQTLERVGKPENEKAIGAVYQQIESALKGIKNDPNILALHSRVETAMAKLFAPQSKT